MEPFFVNRSQILVKFSMCLYQQDYYIFKWFLPTNCWGRLLYRIPVSWLQWAQFSTGMDKCYSLPVKPKHSEAWDTHVLTFPLWQLTAGFCFCSFRTCISHELGLSSQTLQASVHPLTQIQQQPGSPHTQDLLSLPSGFRRCRNDTLQQSTGMRKSWDPHQIWWILPAQSFSQPVNKKLFCNFQNQPCIRIVFSPLLSIFKKINLCITKVHSPMGWIDHLLNSVQ